ncbi:hypothetical protein H9Y05_08620 [Crocinitomicaceae bacterium CZZ-1]|uniref:Uncharacterized protein n=1 Tax=Taishania pollutisoli TaxID=2766479 RepID=A0A8J6PEI5_9FLAO|nr:hypothetical protein [Taishania pollutisoli]MBC9812530.1 hypothetical protein [Taishania pollutisoli]MBX2949427.1 hypothetical protein [Crocinitomicaceae bacterium]NGF74506.1 hypothetical protein [Fluviicola sp. SGL-29]
MKKWLILSLSFCTFILTGCIEIIDDLSLNSDGSGSFKYSINLSSSKVKINSILALDSLDGRPVPSKDEIKQKISDFKSKLAQQEGIKNILIEEDFTNYIFKLSCDFDNVTLLQEGIKKTINGITKHQKNEMDEYQWISWTNNTLSRSIPKIAVDQANKLKADDMELLKQGTYTCITRFDREIEKFDNESAILAKNKQAVMLRLNTHALIKNVDLMGNKIYLMD